MSKLTKKVGKINSSTGLQSGPISDEREFIKDTTKLFGKHNLNKYEESTPYTPPYKVYTALLTQTGTDAPVATVLENTLGGAPVWTRIDVGEYRITLANTFTINKTWAIYTNAPMDDDITGNATIKFDFNFLHWNDGYLSLRTSNNSEDRQDDVLSSPITIEIRVYD